MNFFFNLKILGYMIVGNYYQEGIIEMEEDLTEIKEVENYIIEDLLEAIGNDIKQRNKSVIQYIRDLVRGGKI